MIYIQSGQNVLKWTKFFCIRIDKPTNWKIHIFTFPPNTRGVFQVSGQNKLPLAMITVMIEIFYVWPCAIEGGVDKEAPMGKKCLDEKIF